MKPNQLATLVLRMMGIYCLVQAMPDLATAGGMAARILRWPDLSGEMLSVLVLPPAGQFVMGVLLLVFSTSLGGKLSPNAGQANVTTVSFESVQVLAFAVAGMLIFAGTLERLLSEVWSFLVRWQASGRIPAMSEWEMLSVIGTLLKAALGLWLFFGAAGFAKFWRSTQTSRTSRPTSEN